MARALALALVMSLLLVEVARGADDAPANGVLLVAKPGLGDPNFRETVVLITQPVAGGGPLGVILNRPTEFRLSQVVPSVGAVPAQFDRVYVGGPVARNQIIYLVHTDESLATGLPVVDHVYLSGDAKLMQDIIAGVIKVNGLRAYAGYAGWAPRQLQAEIAAGGWYMLPADAATIFSDDAASLWPALIRKITQRSTQRAPGQDSKNSLTLSIHDFARGLCLPESLALMASSSASNSR